MVCRKETVACQVRKQENFVLTTYNPLYSSTKDGESEGVGIEANQKCSQRTCSEQERKGPFTLGVLVLC